MLTECRAILSRVPDDVRLDLGNVEWTWPDKELVVDPSREEEARIKRFKMGITDRERESPYTDLDAADAKAARLWGFADDVTGYRRTLLHATLGIPSAPVPAGPEPEEPEPADGAQPPD